jgi:2,4-dienoyl-CoA reductase-like NADH-dependent reductase (Old Yellow Enzyme family)
MITRLRHQMQRLAAVDSGQADAIAFGRLFIANPELVARVRRGAALNAPDRATFYGGDAHVAIPTIPCWHRNPRRQ